MHNDLKTITFTGELHTGVDQDTVVMQMAQRLRITPEQAHKIVDSGKPKKLKRGLSADKAAAYQQVLEDLGLKTEIIDETPSATPEHAEPRQIPAAQTLEVSEPEPPDETPVTQAPATQSRFSPGLLGWMILVGVGLVVAASALVEALVIRDEAIPLDASTLDAGGLALAGVLGVALVSYFLGWVVWLLGKRKAGGGQLLFCLMVLILGAVAVWFNAEKLLAKMAQITEQRASIAEVQTSFGALLSERSSAYNTAAEQLDLNVGAISAPHHIDEMRNALVTFRNASAELGEIQLRGGTILAERLVRAGVAQPLVEDFLSGYQSRASANLAFNTGTRRYEANVVETWLNILNLLESSWGRWTPDPQNLSIHTDDAHLQERYNALVERLASAHQNAPKDPAG